MKAHFTWLAALLAVACSCDGDGAGGSAGGGKDAAADTITDASSVLDALSDAADGQACDPTPTSQDIPKDWLRFPGVPCKCDIWMAPNSEAMLPKPAWITTPPGVLELEHNWGDPKFRILGGSAHGGSYPGGHHVTFTRDLGEERFEVVTLRLPANEVLFQARIGGKQCHLRTVSYGQGRVMHLIWESTVDDSPRFIGLFSADDEGQPWTVHAERSPVVVPGFAVSENIGAWLRSGNARIDVFGAQDDGKYPGAWEAPGHRTAQSSSLRAWDDALFWDTHGPEPWSEVWIWTPSAGAQIMLPHTGNTLGQVGSTCGLGTDGKTMVWTQSSGWNGKEWQTIEIYKSPHSTDPKGLKPVKVREATGGKGPCKPWIVDGDYAATTANHDKTGSPAAFLPVVLRLSDGMRWKIDRRPGRLWGWPLYVTESEVAFEEGLPNNTDSGVYPYESWSIVRYPLSLLGPGVPP